MVQVWQLATLCQEVRQLNKAEGVLNVSGIAGGSVLLERDTFDKLFPFGWEEQELVEKDGVRRIFRYDGIEFDCIRYYKDDAQKLNREEAQEREKAFWDIGLDPERNGGDWDV